MTFHFMKNSTEAGSIHVERSAHLPLGAAMKRSAQRVKAENGNSFESLHVTTQTFLGVFRVTVTAHARRLQEAKESMVCFGR